MWQVLGQDKAIRFLESSLKRGGLAHAYLLVGPPHVGKMTLACDIAKTLNCTGDNPPCGQCPACVRVTSGKYADVASVGRVKDEKSGRLKRDIGIDQMRDVQKAAHLPPYEGKFKVFIIDGAELLSTDAANCFLKTLEEPPPHIVFLLLAGKESDVLPTVVSRCQRVEVRPLPPERIEAALVDRWAVGPAQARLLAHLSQGCLGWALQAKDKPELLQQRVDMAERFRQLAGSGYEPRFAFAAELATQHEQSPEQVSHVLGLWGLWWRDLLMVRGGCPRWSVNIEQVDKLSKSEYASLSTSQITGSIRRLEATVQHLRRNANPRLALEALMLELPRVTSA
ncbi:MAG: DNA polymerase III subunit delta' [Chloroflexi bacterium]|nr:DNA polymerase III subunit delta' [Chloroflexota bacterium]